MQDINVDHEIEKLKKFDDAYFNDSEIIPDAQYDELKEKVRTMCPDHPYFSSVGHEERGGKIDLPYPMGSLDQIHEGDYTKWINKHNLHHQNIVISEKLDGISALLVYENKKLKKAYSRGNGIQGADITRHIRHITSAPQSINIDCDYFVVRTEVIMKNKTFEKKYASKFRNPRQMVAGCMNRKKTEHSVLADIDVVAYEIVDMSNATELLTNDTKEARFKLLQEAGFRVAYREVDSVYSHSDASLAETLDRFRTHTEYMIDGLVITADDYLNVDSNRKSNSLNPEHSVKFKVLAEDSMVDTRVVDVHWKLSKSNYWKPRIEIEPVDLFGTTVTFATGFNGKFIYDKKIGKGAVVKITKAGEVIPYVVDVIKPAPVTSEPDGAWEWDSLGVEFISSDESPEVVIMQLVHFFKSIEVEYLQEKSLRKIISYYDLFSNTSVSFEDVATQIIGLLDAEWKRALGENGAKIFLSLHKKLSNIKPEKLLGASPFFGRGFGVRKGKKIMDAMSFDQFLNETDANDIQNVEGFNETASEVYNGIETFKSFYNSIKYYVEFEEVEKDDSLDGEVVVMTGFRDKEIKEFIENSGGRVASAVSGKTTLVIAADVNSTSGKIKKAKEMNIPIFSIKEFQHEYIL